MTERLNGIQTNSTTARRMISEDGTRIGRARHQVREVRIDRTAGLRPEYQREAKKSALVAIVTMIGCRRP